MEQMAPPAGETVPSVSSARSGSLSAGWRGESQVALLVGVEC